MIPPRILHVDDDAVSRLVLGTWLEHNGYTTTSAATAEEAEQHLAQGEFDLLISDIHMPGNHRLEWVERLLRSRHTLPILLLTGNPEFETAHRAANLPVAGYLLKPPDFTTLKAHLDRQINAGRRRRQSTELMREVQALLATRSAEGETDPALTRLEELAHSLADHVASPHPRDVAATEADASLRNALLETVAVIEKTKHSFRSKELGLLRQRLETLLEQTLV